VAKFKVVTPAGVSYTAPGAGYEPELEALRGQHAQLLAEETKLTEASKKLSAHVEAFRATLRG